MVASSAAVPVMIAAIEACTVEANCIASVAGWPACTVVVATPATVAAGDPTTVEEAEQAVTDRRERQAQALLATQSIHLLTNVAMGSSVRDSPPH